ncbi:rRNA-processing protein UTP23 homolog [Clytia hemisphaerica]|uniref:rRNA-processing protein UTP23 homolog n=1 Tax=Clytia hemisphaerica TaxID=252671 RepID=A0A7M5V403_9CNID
MRIKRLKHCKKYVNFYKTTYGFREPYQILVDLTFCQYALTYKVNIKEQVPKYIEGESQLFTTSCILEEGKQLGKQLGGAVHICKQFKLRKCGHSKAVPAQECILSMIGDTNDNHFFVASQDSELRDHLRTIPGVPLLRIHYNALVLEKPSKDSITEAQKIDSVKVSASGYEKERLDQLKKMKGLAEDVGVEEQLKKPKKVKGVNPLAAKKKKAKNGGAFGKQTDPSKKRSRKKTRIAQHVLDELKKQSDGQQNITSS